MNNKQLYVIQVDQCKGHKAHAEQFLQSGNQFFLHSGGRGNGAQAGLYTAKQINRIIGRYPEGVAKAVPVAIGWSQSQVDYFAENVDRMVALDDAGVDNWDGYAEAMCALERRKEARGEQS